MLGELVHGHAAKHVPCDVGERVIPFSETPQAPDLVGDRPVGTERPRRCGAALLDPILPVVRGMGEPIPFVLAGH